MANAVEWDKDAVNQSFTYRGRDAKLRLEECLAQAKSNPRYRWFADEAAAKASVYDYLDGRSFLVSREELLAALRELRAVPAPKLEIFDREDFERCRLVEIDSLLKQYAAAT